MNWIGADISISLDSQTRFTERERIGEEWYSSLAKSMSMVNENIQQYGRMTRHIYKDILIKLVVDYSQSFIAASNKKSSAVLLCYCLIEL